jgi:hypothetical protein
MSVFAKAAAKKEKDTATKAKKQTVWLVGGDDKVAKAIHELVGLAAQAKAIEAKSKIFKTLVLNHAKDQYYTQYANLGVSPETPMKVQNSEGEAVTFVVQERSQYGVKDESVDALTQILGEEGASELIYEETVFGFNREILAVPGVMEVLGSHIEAAMRDLVESGVLGEDKAGELLDAETKRSFRPGILQRLGLIAGKSAQRIRQICDAMGSSCVQYVKT